MQETQGFSRFPREEESEATPGLSPIKAFLVVGAMFAAVAGGVALTRPDAPAIPSTAPGEPDFSLTNAEAIEEFKRLRGLLQDAYRRRDLTQVKLFAAPESSFARRVEQEIQTLVRDRVTDQTQVDTVSSRVESNQRAQIVIEEVQLEAPRFLHATTKEDLTVNHGRVRQVVRWTLVLQGSSWRISDAVVMSSQRVPDQKS